MWHLIWLCFPLPFSIGAFVVCWTPGLVVLLLDGLNCTRCEVQNVKRWFLLLALLNSVMNPIIYSYKDDEMSSTMRRMICCSSEEITQERRSSRIPSAVLNRSTDSSSQYIENGISQGTISGKENTWAVLLPHPRCGQQWRETGRNSEPLKYWKPETAEGHVLGTKTPELPHIFVNNCWVK